LFYAAVCEACSVFAFSPSAPSSVDILAERGRRQRKESPDDPSHADG